MNCTHLIAIRFHKTLKTFPQMEVMFIYVFGLHPDSPPPLTYQKRRKKAEVYLR
jgi:hypothetical protein